MLLEVRATRMMEGKVKDGTIDNPRVSSLGLQLADNKNYMRARFE